MFIPPYVHPSMNFVSLAFLHGYQDYQAKSYLTQIISEIHMHNHCLQNESQVKSITKHSFSPTSLASQKILKNKTAPKTRLFNHDYFRKQIFLCERIILFIKKISKQAFSCTYHSFFSVILLLVFG